jgi:hypothetical protein
MEQWKEIPGWEGYYAASTFGRIKRLAGSPRCLKDRVLKPMKSGNWGGYLTASPVRVGHKQRPMMVHRLVLMAFAGLPPSPAHEGNHINGDKLDNRPENLEWVTRAENIKHAYDTNLHGRYVGSNASAAKLTEADVADILKRIAAREYRRDLAREYGISTKSIDDMVSGHNWRHVPRPDMSGKRLGRHKLVEADIPVIRQMLAEGHVCRVIGERFGVSGGTIQFIKDGRSWKHVP